jgi:hypothetical protein
MDQALSLVKKMVNCNCKIVTRLKIPEYGPPSILTPNMDPQNGPQIWTPQ